LDTNHLTAATDFWVSVFVGRGGPRHPHGEGKETWKCLLTLSASASPLHVVACRLASEEIILAHHMEMNQTPRPFQWLPSSCLLHQLLHQQIYERPRSK
jgi:hypothetical protein